MQLSFIYVENYHKLGQRFITPTVIPHESQSLNQHNVSHLLHRCHTSIWLQVAHQIMCPATRADVQVWFVGLLSSCGHGELFHPLLCVMGTICLLCHCRRLIDAKCLWSMPDTLWCGCEQGRRRASLDVYVAFVSFNNLVSDLWRMYECFSITALCICWQVKLSL